MVLEKRLSMKLLKGKFAYYPQAAVMALGVVALGYVIWHSHAAALVGDINGDGVVNVLDLSVLLTDWGTNNASADLNHDGAVNTLDLSILLAHWTG